MTRRTVWLVALGVLALLAFALATLPAGVAAGPLRKAGIDAAAFGGSLWSGRATGMSWRGAAAGDAEWKIAPTRLLMGRIAGHARLRRTDGSVETDFDLSFTGREARFRAVRIELPLAALNALPLGMPKGWHLNTCLVNFYGDRQDGTRWVDVARVGDHRDFEPGPVASLSIGERALFQFVARGGGGGSASARTLRSRTPCGGS